MQNNLKKTKNLKKKTKKLHHVFLPNNLAIGILLKNGTS